MDPNRLTPKQVIDEGMQPCRAVPKSENLDRAITEAARLNVVETTYLIGLLQAELEVYRATLVDAIFNLKSN